MLIYHPSNSKFNIIKTYFFGLNFYTKNDVKASRVPRTFWYLKIPIPEERLRNTRFTYVANMNKKRIYDLRKDKEKLIGKFASIHELLLYLRKKYTGVIYNVGYDIIAIFKDIKPIKIIEK